MVGAEHRRHWHELSVKDPRKEHDGRTPWIPLGRMGRAGEEHHGRALMFSSLIVCASAALVVPTLSTRGKWVATVMICAVGVLLQARDEREQSNHHGLCGGAARPPRRLWSTRGSRSSRSGRSATVRGGQVAPSRPGRRAIRARSAITPHGRSQARTAKGHKPVSLPTEMPPERTGTVQPDDPDRSVPMSFHHRDSGGGCPGHKRRQEPKIGRP
jgi:hypothetical protein